MTNHYHLLVETIDGGLNRGMRQLNATYAQYLNRRHRSVGHVFQGRYKAILCQKQSYLLELSRYVILNPVRAKMVSSADQWPWSSHRYLIGMDRAPGWLATDWLLSQFGNDRACAVASYLEFVARGLHAPSPLQDVQHQCLLGDGAFVSGYFDDKKPAELTEIARAQRKPTAHSLEYYFARNADRDEAIAEAYRTTAFSMSEIAKHCGVCVRTVSRAVARTERKTLTV